MIVIGVGTNVDGRWGHPKNTINRAICELANCGIEIVDQSKLYRTEAYAYIRQPDYLNAIITVATTLQPNALLQVLKRIEVNAGRVKTKSGLLPYFQWRPRPLDLDIISYKSIVHNWRGLRPAAHARLILPHPRAHERAFVLCPLAAIAPFWHHPVFGATAAQLLKRPAVRATGKILASEDF